jgi:hypothetical protein
LMIMRPHRLAWSRTPDFHSGNRGSNPLGDAKIKSTEKTRCFFLYNNRLKPSRLYCLPAKAITRRPEGTEGIGSKIMYE